MVQVFHVVRCFSCQSFQVQQVKKVKKWSCKLCGEKQTLVKEFGRGSGADCRRHVQKLNAMRGAVLEEQEHAAWSLWEQAEEEAEPEEEQQVSHTQVSRWSKYLANPEEAEAEEDEDGLFDRKQLHGNGMNERKRKRGGAPSCSPEQEDTPPPTRTSIASQNQSCLYTEKAPPTRQVVPPADHLPPPSKRLTPPSAGSGCVSRWARFIGSEQREGEDSQGIGLDPSVGGASVSPDSDVIGQTLPVHRPRLLSPFSPLFDSGEDFMIDDFL
ncbi:MRN complex-interacting protein [Cheilinus undulatus]|uniref:MRN complex-interacting protein n=1 Tax=Cheilinus undulatus TaxID=241271 RepID=UPI001BD4ADC7|nr:MRN complex-interacting protein [Cheilinus undulatus]